MRMTIDVPYTFNFEVDTPSPTVPRPRQPAPQSRGRRGTFNLYVDLVPSSAWFSNLRAELTESEWQACKRFAAKRAGYCCEICEGKGPKWPVECHERWDFDEQKGIQRLRALEALCPDCHESTHMGLAEVRGRFRPAMDHLIKVNSWSEAQAKAHLHEAVRDFLRRSEMPWLLDASLLLELPINLGEHSRKVIERHAALARQAIVDPDLARSALTEHVRGPEPH